MRGSLERPERVAKERSERGTGCPVKGTRICCLTKGARGEGAPLAPSTSLSWSRLALRRAAMGGRQRARRGIAEGVSRAACLPKGVDRVAFLPKGIGRAACFPKRVDPAAFLRPDPTHESPYLGQRSSDTEAGRPCSSG